MENWIYKFIDFKGKVIYVGKTKNIKNRMKQHFSLKKNSSDKEKIFTGHLPDECYLNVNHIMVAKVSGQTDTEIYETYYINKFKPLYNIDKLFLENQDSNIPLTELEFHECYIKQIAPLKISFTKMGYKYKGFTLLEKVIETININHLIINYRSGIINNDWELLYKIVTFLHICLSNIDTCINLEETSFDEDLNNNVKPLINLSPKIYTLFGINFIKELENIGMIINIDNEIYLTMLQYPIANTNDPSCLKDSKNLKNLKNSESCKAI